MDTATTISVLRSLSQYEIDVVQAYRQAVPLLTEHTPVREEVDRMRADHERHILEMGEILRALGEVPPRYARDLRGYLMACMTALRTASQPENAVQAIQAIARAALDRYDRALQEDLPLEVAVNLSSNRATLARHLDTLAALLTQVGSAPLHLPTPPREPDLSSSP